MDINNQSNVTKGKNGGNDIYVKKGFSFTKMKIITTEVKTGIDVDFFICESMIDINVYYKIKLPHNRTSEHICEEQITRHMKITDTVLIFFAPTKLIFDEIKTSFRFFLLSFAIWIPFWTTIRLQS